MKKILIAEDNDSNFVLMTYILKKFYQFDRARNGQEAVDMVDKDQYDIVLMDIKMPVMTGLEATKLIKAKYPDLPVVALTANAFDSDRQAARGIKVRALSPYASSRSKTCRSLSMAGFSFVSCSNCSRRVSGLTCS